MAMSSINPIKLETLFNLKQFGINENSIKYDSISMESDKCILVKEDTKLSIVDITSRKVSSLAIGSISSAKMNPSTSVLGIQKDNDLQIFNLSMKTKVKSIQTKEAILYWRWLNPQTIAYITAKAAYHWSMEADSKPQKAFDVIAEDRKIQCIGYDSSNDGNWLYLQAIAKSTHNNSIEGSLQLFNVASKKYQPRMNAHGGCFAYLNRNGRQGTLFCFTRHLAPESVTKLFIVEIGNKESNTNPVNVQREIRFEHSNDFMIAMIPSNKCGCVYAVSQKGYLYVFDLSTAKQMYYKRISNASIFCAAAAHNGNGNDEGIIICDRNGNVISIAINPNTYVPYIMNELNDKKMAISIAARFNLTGADHIFQTRFKELISNLQFEEAVRFAVKAPRQILRTPETIQLLEQAPNTCYPPPDLQFYTLILQNEGALNQSESIGLCLRILNAKPKEGISKIEKFLTEEKLYYSQDLGDLLVRYSAKLAATVYYKAKVPSKTILCFIKCGNSDRIIQYCITEDYAPNNWTEIIGNVLSMDRENIVTFATQLIAKKYLKPMEIVNALLGFARNEIEKTTQFLLTYLSERDDEKEDYDLQTKLFEINLKSSPQIADALFGEAKFSNYDRLYIAQLCEGAKLYHRALEHFESLEDIKRVLQTGIAANTLTKEFVLTFFGDLTSEDALQCLKDLLMYQSTQLHLQIVVGIAVQYMKELKIERLIDLFEETESWMGLYLFLSNIIQETQDKDLTYKYIVSAAKCKQFEQVRSVCAESDYYEPERVKTFLLDNTDVIKDPRALIHVCDRFGFVTDLTHYLYSNQMYRFLEVYVHKMNESAAPKVVGTLLDLNCSEEQIQELLRHVRPPQCSIAELVDEIEKRERLNLLLPWLEARYDNGKNDSALHNALCKIYVNINNNPSHFLSTNKFYDHAIVGKYCESRDPRLAFIAYKECANGDCEELLLNLCNKNGFYKDLAKYCLERNDLHLWNTVLNQSRENEEKESEEHKHERALIGQVIAGAIILSNNSTKSAQISTVIKAFMQSDLSNELIQLLEKIIFSNNINYTNLQNNFNKNGNLQTLLMFTAVKADPSRLIAYIDRLEHFDAMNIASVCKQDNYKLYQESFLIYKKFKHNIEAMDVLVNKLADLERAKAFAHYCAEACVFSILGKAQFENEMIRESIESFIKAKDAQYYNEIIFEINKCDTTELYQELIKYLLMAREDSKVRDTKIDSELLYCYAKTDELALFDAFIHQCNNNMSKIGERLFNESFFKFAKLIFKKMKNYSKLALCSVQLNEFKEAIDACMKANCIQTWKNVCFACVDSHKFKLAQMCGVHIITFMDHLRDLIKHYEANGHFMELIRLLEHGLNLDRAHQGLYTELAILYAKYNEERLMEHLRLFWDRLNICQLINACVDNQHWKESVFLYQKYNQYENAAQVMILHSSQCWDNDEFKSVLLNIGNGCDTFYKAVQFYLNEHPLLLSELMIEMSHKIDHKRVIGTIRLSNPQKLYLIKDYLLFIQQRHNLRSINEALHELLIEEDDYKSLRQSIEQNSEFDQIALAQALQKHELLEFRRIAAYLYRRNERYSTAIELSKQDQLWQDMMDACAVSNDHKLVEKVLRNFVESIENEQCPKSCFAACLFTCFEVIKPDLVLELSFTHDLFDLSMPFLVQSMKRFDEKFASLHGSVEDLRQKLAAFTCTQTEMNNSSNNIEPMLPMIGYVPPQHHGHNNNNNGLYGGLGFM